MGSVSIGADGQYELAERRDPVWRVRLYQPGGSCVADLRLAMSSRDALVLIDVLTYGQRQKPVLGFSVESDPQKH